MGRDPDIVLPHVPGHELAGVVVAVGAEVATASLGDRVTVPFCGGCGTCRTCRTGNTQICDRATQPGFTGWGSFAEFVAIEHADANLIHLPETIGDAAAALLGCRFITAHRAVVDRAAVRPGEWLAVHGCGGVGLSAVMIAAAIGARVIAIDVDGHALDRAAALGAEITIDASSIDDIPSAVRARPTVAHMRRSMRWVPRSPLRTRCSASASSAATCRRACSTTTPHPCR